ncbi:MAG TPA: Asp-tRNA(Asn)/Glu-tRNA(Gln) amidotransferase subunit GatC [Holophagaceae bacterium]|jgi:aspartyl-tRNA(Asn)/glutamyl-tRNA(Gln) amidotransferase subunit C|nr:Asp-tRNA(Asn)/Glu-tRNA(Gln) amidotransferase subunit GatC [Holophagaceae bacterium]
MNVTREDVLHCAKLARLSLRDEEIEPLRQAMVQLLSRAEKLDALPLEDVPPMLHALALPLPRREDEIGPSLTQEAALSNAPAQSHGHFVVPKVL